MTGLSVIWKAAAAYIISTFFACLNVAPVTVTFIYGANDVVVRATVHGPAASLSVFRQDTKALPAPGIQLWSRH